jgi:two-component system sensor histidine kinase BaeS
MKPHLIYKLLAIHLVVIAFIMAVVWFSIDTLAAGYFVTLMEKYHISPEPAHDMFVSAIHRYLIWAFLAAVLLAIGLSFLMMRKALAPLTQMTEISRKIAAGEFAVRVPAASHDEVGQLALAFNAMAQSLEKMERLRRNLMIDVTHELRTPLTNIRGYLEALGDGVLPPSDETFALLNAETMRLVQLVEDVLDLAKADAAKGHLNLEPVDIKESLDHILALFDRTLAQKNISLSVQAPTPKVVVPADRHRFVRVLRNLVDNAVRYTPVGGTIEIHILPTPTAVAIDFFNPAANLSDRDLPLLFERFYRGEKSRSREHGGAGIGLSIVKELVEANGGSVKAAMEGTRLRISLTLPAASTPSGN